MGEMRWARRISFLFFFSLFPFALLEFFFLSFDPSIPFPSSPSSPPSFFTSFFPLTATISQPLLPGTFAFLILTLARHETHYRSTLQPLACAIAWSTITHILADLSSKRDEHQSTEAIHAVPYTSPLHALLQHVQPHNRLLPKVQGF
jgi:hypothetical protein